MKSDYRRFNINPAAAGDDYAAMAEALRRRYTRAKGAARSRCPMSCLSTAAKAS